MSSLSLRDLRYLCPSIRGHICHLRNIQPHRGTQQKRRHFSPHQNHAIILHSLLLPKAM